MKPSPASHDRSTQAPELRQLIEQVDAARAARTPVYIEGGGTKRFYGEPPFGTPLSTTSLRGIANYEPSELVITARCGTPLQDIEAALDQNGQHLAFEPPHFEPGGTVGGMVAAGLSGPARASSGAVRDFVLGAAMLDGRGQVLNFGGQVIKNVAGYDVSRLLAGSLGTLGIILEVSLRVAPKPAAVCTRVFELDQTVALESVNRWLGQALPVNASAWHEGRLTIRLAGATAAVRAAASRLGGEPMSEADATAYWLGLRDHRHPFFGPVHQNDAVDQHAPPTWRLSVPPTCAPLALPGEVPQLIEWHGGQRWLRTREPADRIRALAAAAGGHATRFRGAGDAPAFTPVAAPLDRIHHALKQTFDPDGIFNIGRLHPTDPHANRAFP